MRYLKLKTYNGDIYVNPRKVRSVARAWGDRLAVTFDSGNYVIVEGELTDILDKLQQADRLYTGEDWK